MVVKKRNNYHYKYSLCAENRLSVGGGFTVTKKCRGNKESARSRILATGKIVRI